MKSQQLIRRVSFVPVIAREYCLAATPFFDPVTAEYICVFLLLVLSCLVVRQKFRVWLIYIYFGYKYQT